MASYVRRGLEQKPEDCRKLDTCYKIAMIQDKDLAGDWQYAEAIRKVCAKCPEFEKVSALFS